MDNKVLACMRRFDAINGLLVPGGSGNLTKGNPFYDNTEYLLKLAIEANDNGDYFPVQSWSHCSWSYSPDVCVLPRMSAVLHLTPGFGVGCHAYLCWTHTYVV